ncbi:YcxB family protein [Oceanobacillus senegalensis]|uniref:YcxB family protein n=1 Tax=Oceanobacillus senegalensis TaxID=1936063 RepID=UPI000A313A01|nr:YcxB family protein [Oceanobacillus senegalensis]
MENENAEMMLTGNITYEDFKKHNAYHTRKFLIGHFLLEVMVLSALIVYFFNEIGIFLSFVFGYSIFLAWISIIVVSLLISSVIAVPLTLVLILLLKSRVRKEYQSDTQIKRDVSYVISNQGIHQKRGRSNTYFEWGDIVQAYEHKEMFRLYVSKNKAILLPKRFFRTNKDVDVFKNMIQNNLDDKRVIMKN